MSRIVLKIPIKPLSYNQYYRNTRTGKRIKTGAGLAYDEELGEFLQSKRLELEAFGSSIMSTESVKITIYNLKTNFFIKDGSRLNLKAGDWDNPVKVLQDKIFDVICCDDIIVKWGEVLDIPSRDIDGCIVTLETIYTPKPLSFYDFSAG